MELRSIDAVEAFVTKDGSTIRELHHTKVQSLAEATLEVEQATERHYHRVTEEIYFVLKGQGKMEVDGETTHVRPGDAVLIPAGARGRLGPLVGWCWGETGENHEGPFAATLAHAGAGHRRARRGRRRGICDVGT